MNANNDNFSQGLFLAEEAVLVDSSRIIHTPSAFARASLFHLQETGTLQAVRPHTSRRNGLGSFLFFVVLSGSGRLQYGRGEYGLQEGDCVFIDCRKPYAHSTLEELWKLKWVHFYGSNMMEVYEKYRSRGGTPVFRPKTIEPYQKNLDELFRIADSFSYVRDMEIHAKLSELLVFLMQDAWQERQGEQEADEKLMPRSRGVDIRKVKEYLEEHFSEKISLEDMENIFYINKFYLLKLFKNRYGATVNDYLALCRITKAKQLLRFTDKTMEEISCECGFGSAAYMGRIFKKIEETTPGEYRKQWQNP